MFYLALVGTLAALLLLTVFVTARKPTSSSTPAAIVARAATLPARAMPAPPPYRVVLRPRPPAPRPSPSRVEGFVWGSLAKPLVNPRPSQQRLASRLAEPPRPTPVKPSAAVAQVSPAPQKSRAAPAPRRPSPGNLSTPASPQASRELGRQLLGSDGKREGNVPLISMDYCATLGWAGYVRGMQKLGGEFFLYDPIRQRILARADVRSNQFEPVAGEALRHLSPRMRQIEGEPAIGPLLARGRKQFNVADPSLILLLPLETDFEIVGGLVGALANRPVPNKPVARVSGIYEPAAGGVQLHVAQLFDAEGKVEPYDLVLPLQGLNQAQGMPRR